jgi:hypothetical protein
MNGSVRVQYTLWSRGRLLGETELAYRRAWPTLMAGDFFPNELGERLMPIITGVGPALFALSDVSEEVARANPEAVRSDDWPDGVRQTSEYADAISLSDELESLDLELRSADGAVVETERLWIQDTHRLLAMAELEDDDPLDDEEMSDELRESIEHDIAIMEEHFASLEMEDRPWEPEKEFPRYQIFAALVGHDRYMTREAGDSVE